jgi:hypothetical protein
LCRQVTRDAGLFVCRQNVVRIPDTGERDYKEQLVGAATALETFGAPE